MTDTELQGAFRKSAEAAARFRRMADGAQPGTPAVDAYAQAATTATARAHEYRNQINANRRKDALT